MSEHRNLNDGWLYADRFHEDMIRNSYDDSNMNAVRLPHTNVETPYHYFDDRIYQFVSCYRRKLVVEPTWSDKHVLLTFEGVAHVAKVYINETLAATHYGGYTAFTAEIGPYLNYSKEASNIIVIEVDSRESCNVPPFGNVIDYLTYGGIYREVYLDVKEEAYIEDVFVQTKNVLNPEKELVFDLSLNEEKFENLWMKYTINESRVDNSEMSPDGNSSILYSDTIQLTTRLTNVSCIITGAENWELEHPKLYDLQIQLYRKTVPRPTDKDEHRKASDITEDDVIIDVKTVRFGFRSCEFRADGFYLNNKKIKLIGLNRHQSFPYVGYAMPKRMQRRDAEILKNELHVNIVRTSHYPQSKHFINRCDELGLLVFTEIPGWQHIGNEEWKRIACDDVKEMVMQYRNHPSVILWGVRINESQDDDELYRKTNAIAHELDPSRQTGGVRYLKKSSLLEDVFTYNDFIHNGQTKGLDRKEEVSPNDKAPYLVTEFNGHMFPTKSFDDEEHRLNHALRHACVLDASFEQEEIAGAIGWCMFDYNTHKDFGSGDRICYHGVMDMFRNPKPAAAVYATQLNEKQVVCEVTSTMDIGEHPAGNIGDIYVFTNSDSVKLYKNDTFIKEFHPSSTMYHHLPHPPFIIDDFVGNLLEVNEHYSHKTAEGLKDILYAVRRYGQNNLPLKYKLKMAYLMLKEHINLEEGTRLYNQYIGNWGNATTTFRFEAIKDQKVGKVIEKIPVSKPTLIAIPDTTELMEEETYDVSAVRITAVDECGNRLAYYQEPIKLKAFGAVELIGPDIVSLKGGACGTFVKTNGTKGEGLLMIEQEESEEITIRFNVS